MIRPAGFKVLRISLAASCAVALAIPFASYAETRRITKSDVAPAFGGVTILQDDPLEKEKVEYPVTGKGNYDEFFRSSAQLHAGMIISQSATDSLTTNLKKYARSYAASKATDQNVKNIVGDSKPQDLKDDQALALLNLKKKNGELTSEETAFAGKSVASAAVLTAFLAKTPGQANDLTTQGTALTKSVPSDFSGFNAMKAPGVTAGLNQSLTNVKGASAKAPELAKSLARLSEGLQSLR